MIYFENDVINYLRIPSIPKKIHDGSSPFDKGVAIVEQIDGANAYVVCSFKPEEGDKEPRITKVFGYVPFRKVLQVFVVPNYMTNIEDVANMDLDDESKKKAENILKEAHEMENEGTKDENPMENLPEWIFPEIHSKDEAIAWLKNFQSRNKQKGRIPTTEENVKLRLYSIYCELQNKTK